MAKAPSWTTKAPDVVSFVLAIASRIGDRDARSRGGVAAGATDDLASSTGVIGVAGMSTTGVSGTVTEPDAACFASIVGIAGSGAATGTVTDDGFETGMAAATAAGGAAPTASVAGDVNASRVGNPLSVDGVTPSIAATWLGPASGLDSAAQLRI